MRITRKRSSITWRRMGATVRGTPCGCKQREAMRACIWAVICDDCMVNDCIIKAAF